MSLSGSEWREGQLNFLVPRNHGRTPVEVNNLPNEQVGKRNTSHKPERYSSTIHERAHINLGRVCEVSFIARTTLSHRDGDTESSEHIGVDFSSPVGLNPFEGVPEMQLLSFVCRVRASQVLLISASVWFAFSTVGWSQSSTSTVLGTVVDAQGDAVFRRICPGRNQA
jgi:hypothetical protein